ncbi:hypothetical protein LR48_Vigan08g146600 [Vigna angularis]|uniref:(+)RNA virus helicase C-terminal domain-containing protein n=1 Tax=Phaseolus angularis TaxID=3914 RepID=A0A0L9V7I3_PHAAN|nr:hypothetical protein LR48_Vigan08g146600 [Vigna angularis]
MVDSVVNQRLNGELTVEPVKEKQEKKPELKQSLIDTYVNEEFKGKSTVDADLLVEYMKGDFFRQSNKEIESRDLITFLKSCVKSIVNSLKGEDYVFLRYNDIEVVDTQEKDLKAEESQGAKENTEMRSEVSDVENSEEENQLKQETGNEIGKLVEEVAIVTFEVGSSSNSDESSDDEKRGKAWASMAEESELAESKRKDVEHLDALLCKIISDKSTMMDIIREYAYGMYHESEGTFQKNAGFFRVVKGNVRWEFKKSRTLGHMYAIKFDLETYKSGATLVRLFWGKDSEDRLKIDVPNFTESKNGLFMVCDHTFLMNEMEILKVLKVALTERKHKHMPNATLTDGVPSCGKSTHTVKEASLDKQYVLTMGKEATMDLKERFKRERKAIEAQLKRVRTVDSFFLNDGRSRANVLHFDEAPMVHAGMVYFCVDMLSARIVVCQGDSQQIPFVNRVEAINLRYSELQISNTVKKRLTCRSPLGVVAYLTKKLFYGNSLVMSVNPLVNSMKVFGPRSGMSSFIAYLRLKECTI